MPDVCEVCGKLIELDGYCAKYGKHLQWWLCDECCTQLTDAREADSWASQESTK